MRELSNIELNLKWRRRKLKKFTTLGLSFLCDVGGLSAKGCVNRIRLCLLQGRVEAGIPKRMPVSNPSKGTIRTSYIQPLVRTLVTVVKFWKNTFLRHYPPNDW